MAKTLDQIETLSASLKAGSDAVFDYICQSCNEDGKHLEAVGFCVDCSEFLCDECFRYHLKPKLTRHHKLLDIEEAKKDTNLSGCLDICTDKCAQHNGKAIEYFCLDHDCLGCGVCLNLDHRNCQEVQYIPKIAKDMGNGEEFSTLMRELDKLLLQTKHIADTSLGNKLKSQDIFDKALDHVKQVKIEVNEAFTKLEKEIETEVEKMKKKDLLKMEGNVKSCDNIQTKAQNLSFNMKEMQKKGQYCNLFVAMKTSKTEMRSIVKSLEDISKHNTISHYLFQPSEQLDNFLKHGGNLGKLHMKDAIETKATEIKTKATEIKTKSTEIKTKATEIKTKATEIKTKATEIKTKATKVGEISVKVDSNSKTCDISGMTLISGGRLTVADYNNNRVKLVDLKQCTVISEYQLPCRPYDITTTGESGEIAVTLPTNSEIVLVRVRGDRLYEHKKIKTTGWCVGIAYIKDKFVVSLVEPERLEIIDTQGNVLQTIDKDGNGRTLFSDVWSIAASQDTGTIYVPDGNNNTVTRLSLSGQVLGVYKDRNLKWAHYVTVDKGGVVYVCGKYSHNIHQITPDCKKISILLTRHNGLENPTSLCFDDNTDCLYVGQENNTVWVYQLS